MKYLLIMTILIGGFSAHAVGIPGLLELPSAPSAISESKYFCLPSKFTPVGTTRWLWNKGTKNSY